MSKRSGVDDQIIRPETEKQNRVWTTCESIDRVLLFRNTDEEFRGTKAAAAASRMPRSGWSREGRPFRGPPVFVDADDARSVRLVPDRESIETELAAKTALNAALSRLPSEQREAIELAAGAGMNYHQIAQRTGVGDRTVLRRIDRGLQALRVALRDVPYFDSIGSVESDRS